MNDLYQLIFDVWRVWSSRALRNDPVSHKQLYTRTAVTQQKTTPPSTSAQHTLAIYGSKLNQKLIGGWET